MTKEKVERNQQNCPSGKSLLIFRNRVKPKNQKYFAFPVGQIKGTSIAILSHQEGRSRSSRNAGQGAVDVEVPLTNGAEAYGEDVWSRHRDAGVKFLRSELLRGDGGKKARSPGRARYKP